MNKQTISKNDKNKNKQKQQQQNYQWETWIVFVFSSSEVSEHCVQTTPSLMTTDGNLSSVSVDAGDNDLQFLRNANTCLVENEETAYRAIQDGEQVMCLWY